MAEGKDTYHIAVKYDGEWLMTVQSFKSREKALDFEFWNAKSSGQLVKEGEDFIIVRIFNGELGAIDFDDFPTEFKN